MTHLSSSKIEFEQQRDQRLVLDQQYPPSGQLCPGHDGSLDAAVLPAIVRSPGAVRVAGTTTTHMPSPLGRRQETSRSAALPPAKASRPTCNEPAIMRPPFAGSTNAYDAAGLAVAYPIREIMIPMLPSEQSSPTLPAASRPGRCHPRRPRDIAGCRPCQPGDRDPLFRGYGRIATWRARGRNHGHRLRPVRRGFDSHSAIDVRRSYHAARGLVGVVWCGCDHLGWRIFSRRRRRRWLGWRLRVCHSRNNQTGQTHQCKQIRSHQNSPSSGKRR